MLNFNGAWRFNSPGKVPHGLVVDFYDMLGKMAAQSEPWSVVESCKMKFGGTGRSSNVNWAWSDLHTLMFDMSNNAPLFIEAFYNCCQDLESNFLIVPDTQTINSVLAKHDAGFLIQPPDLIETHASIPITVPRQAPSLNEEARKLIHNCLNESERLLSADEGRRAVQEIFFLLESITTAFRGMGSDTDSIQGKYFGPIVGEMKKRGKGKAQENILNWMSTLHGFLSSPTGGGVRHGTDLREGNAIQPHEARLYCNLARSYLSYLLEEHDQQSKGAPFCSLRQ